MPAPDDLYWNPLDLDPNHEDPYAAVLQTKPYIDSWDLENYAYLRQTLGSVELNSDPSSLDSPGQSLSPDAGSSTYYRRSDSYERTPYATNKYGYRSKQHNHDYDIDELIEEDEKMYESFGEHYGLNYSHEMAHFGLHKYNMADAKLGQYGCVPNQNGGRKSSRQDIYMSMDRTSATIAQNGRNRSRFPENFERSNGAYPAKPEVVMKRRYSEQPRTDFGRMQAEKQKLLPARTEGNAPDRRRVSTSRLPEPTMHNLMEYGSDLEDSLEPEDAMLPIYNTGNRTTMADIYKRNKNQRNSFSYGEYEYDPYRALSPRTTHPLYGRLESIYGLPLMGPPPLYDDVRGGLGLNPPIPKPDHFTLGTYGHLQIDYSCSWTHLNRYIKT